MQNAGSSNQLETVEKTKRQLNLEGIIDDERHAELSHIFRNISIEGWCIYSIIHHSNSYVSKVVLIGAIIAYSKP